MMVLGLFMWLTCSLPAAMLVGHCALSEEWRTRPRRRLAHTATQPAYASARASLLRRVWPSLTFRWASSPYGFPRPRATRSGRTTQPPNPGWPAVFFPG